MAALRSWNVAVDAHEYLDFEIEIGTPNDGDVAPVSVLNAPGGTATGFLDLASLSPVALGNESPTTLQDARNAGAALFDALFRDQILSRYDVSLQMAVLQQKGLRIRLRLFDVRVQRMRWELLLDARSDDFLALSRNTPIVRYLPVGAPIDALEVDLPLRVLALIASPSDLPPVDIAAEKQNLQKALAAMQSKRAVEVVVLDGQGLAALHSALEQGPWHIFHYAGHAQLNPATGAGELLLAGADGASQAVSAQELAQLLADQKSLRLCVLGACEGAKAAESQPFSSLAAALVQEGVPAVLAMSEEISVSAAREFTRAFFGAITASLPVDAAVASARASLRIAAPNSIEWATPVLFLRSPNAVLWRPNPPPLAWKRNAAVATGVVATLVAVALLIWFWALPTYWPSQMRGDFRIAIANFGSLTDAGAMERTELGDSISATIYENLRARNIPIRASSKFEPDVVFWHDSEGRGQKNVTFGSVQGATPEERTRGAKELAERVGADMVLYGWFDGRSSAARSDELHLEYYYATPERSYEPSPTVGNLVFGSPIRPAVSYAINPEPARTDLRRQAARRAELLFWITQGMTKLILNQPEDALELLTEAEETLDDLEPEEGLDLLYLYQAQAAQTARLFDAGLTAVNKALDINPFYVNALILKGDLLMDRSQLFYAGRQRSKEETEAICVDEQILARSSSTQEMAEDDAESAVIWLEQAVDLSPTSPWPEIESFARQDLGFAYRHLGQIELRAGRYDLAEQNLDASVAEINQSLQTLTREARPQYYGWGLSGLGVTYWYKGVLDYSRSVLAYNAGDHSESHMRRDEAFRNMEHSIDIFKQCIDLEPLTQANPVFVDNVLKCACQPYMDEVKKSLEQWQIESGLQVGLAQ